MDDYISFSQLNDFLYSPLSLYLHECYKTYHTQMYDDIPQVAGKKAHATIDNNQYKKKHWITGMWLCSPILRLYGRADLYNDFTGELVERKRKIAYIYEGYKMQIWGQYYCLVEMGYSVSGISLHSLIDNSRYSLGIPTEDNIHQLKDLINRMRIYTPTFDVLEEENEKSSNSIYAALLPTKK